MSLFKGRMERQRCDGGKSRKVCFSASLERERVMVHLTLSIIQLRLYFSIPVPVPCQNLLEGDGILNLIR